MPHFLNQLRSSGKACGLCCTKIENFGVVRGKNEILKNVNLHIHCGELTAVIGPNGAGKSTLLKSILGEIQHSGEMKFLDSKGEHGGKPVIGYVPQQFNFEPGTPVSVYDLFASANSNLPVWLFKSANKRAKIKEVLEIVESGHLIDKKLGNLSGGELQRVFLALALNPVPDLLLLDEPVSGVDVNGLKLFYKIVSELREKFDLSIILVSHDLDLVADFADRVVVLNKTVVCTGKPKEIFNNPQFAALFGSFKIKKTANNRLTKPQTVVTKVALEQIIEIEGR